MEPATAVPYKDYLTTAPSSLLFSGLISNGRGGRGMRRLLPHQKGSIITNSPYNQPPCHARTLLFPLHRYLAASIARFPIMFMLIWSTAT